MKLLPCTYGCVCIVFLCIGDGTDDENGKVSSGDGVGTSGGRRPVIVPRVGTHGLL